MGDQEIERMRRDALEIFQASLRAAGPSECIRRNVKLVDGTLRIGEFSYLLDEFSKLIVVGAGKASVSMAATVEELLGNRIKGGMINTSYGRSQALERIEVNEAGHPLPDEEGVMGTDKIIRLLEKADERTLVLCLISGGGSALMPSPAPGISLGDKQQTTRLLLGCGATIDEINAMRKHLSRIKGGRLCQIAYPAKIVALVLSDVVGDKLDVIASGPTAPDKSTFTDCLGIISRYNLAGKVPQKVIRRLKAGAEGRVEETPKRGNKIFANCQNLIIGSNRLAVETAKEKAISLGYNALILSTQVEGEARDVAKVHAAVAKEILCSGNPIPVPACLISGGETTVTVRGKGLGGRNQEFVLAAVVQIAGLEDMVIFSAGTDGADGPTGAAGAIADGKTLQRAEETGLSAPRFLENNDSYHFFKLLNDLVITGLTGTNVMDIRLVLVR